jgi:HTH domain
MKIKNIVKRKWLPLATLAASEREEAERGILESRYSSRSAISEGWRGKLKPEELAYLLEKNTQVAGNPARLLELLADLPAQKPVEAAAEMLWEERLFLKAFAASRLGREAEAGPLFQSLPQRFQPLVQAERALARLNHGDLAGAESLFRGALEHRNALFDPYSLCSLLGGLSLTLIHQGEFREAERVLRERRNLLKDFPSPVLSFGTRLYEILLLLDRNDFARATALIERSRRENAGASINGFFLLHLWLQLSLARNELESARHAIEELRGLATELKIPDGVLGFRLEEVEWEIRAGKLESAQVLMAGLEKSAKDARDDFLLFRLQVLKALACMRARSADEALREISVAVELGEKRRYRPGLSWAFFHAAGIALAAGDSLQARLFLLRGRRLAEELGLPVRRAAFSYISEVLESRYASASALVSLAKHREIGPELEYFLGAYGLLESVSLLVRDGSGQSSVNEPALRRRLFQEPGLFWFQKEGILLANEGRQEVVTVEFSDRSPLLACFRLFWNAFQGGQGGFTLREVHKTRLSCPYREELHAGAAKMLISRLRQQLGKTGIQLAYFRESGCYEFVAELPAFTILSQAEAEGGEKEKPSRERALLERIGMEPFVSTKALCTEFGVSRQALHPALKKLTEEGKIRLVKRGPVSGYISRLRQ